MSQQNKSFAFFGTPELASNTLAILEAYGYVPKVIITSPDRAQGRGMHVSETPVATWATQHNIPCLKPEKITDEFMEEFKTYQVDLSIVVAYGKILPDSLIQTPKLGTLNIHYSLLPKYRGASPVEQALLNGDTLTGVTIQQMVFKLDSGAVIARKEIEIPINERKESLRNRLTNEGAKLLSEILLDVYAQMTKQETQDENSSTYCTKIHKEDGLIDINGNAEENYNKYRAFEGWPGTYFFVEHNGKKIRVKITEASYESGIFVIQKVIPENKKEMLYSDFARNL